MMSNFRFEQLTIWRDAIRLSGELFDLVERPGLKGNYRFSSQLYGAAMSISNNIAEGSGASSNKEFARYLGIARSSLFEVVNILFLFENRSIISSEERLAFYHRLLTLSKQIQSLRNTLQSN